MGAIRHICEENAARLLPEYAMVGRNHHCDVRLWSRQASGVHAALRWSDGHWQVVDLGSRNGTWVAGARLETGESARLETNVVVSFGSDAESWILTSSEAPMAFARGEEFDVPLVDGVLALSPRTNVRLTMNCDTAKWFAEYDGHRHLVEDREVLLIAGRWRLLLPSVQLPSTERDPHHKRDSRRLCGAQVVVCHDITGEYVTARIVPCRSCPVDLGPRAHHALLLELARIRLADRARGISASQSGWVHREDIARRVGVDVPYVNVLIFRLREQLEELGFPDADSIVERQSRTGMLRVGPEDVRIFRLED